MFARTSDMFRLRKNGCQLGGARKFIRPLLFQTGTTVPRSPALVAWNCKELITPFCSVEDFSPNDESRGMIIKSTPCCLMCATSNVAITAYPFLFSLLCGSVTHPSPAGAACAIGTMFAIPARSDGAVLATERKPNAVYAYPPWL